MHVLRFKQWETAIPDVERAAAAPLSSGRAPIRQSLLSVVTEAYGHDPVPPRIQSATSRMGSACRRGHCAVRPPGVA